MSDSGLNPIDVSALLRPGVFLLWAHNRVTYVGKARCLLAGIAVHQAINRDLPSWVPLHRIRFDKIEIIPCDTTRATALALALIELHNPLHNRPRPTRSEPNPNPTSHVPSPSPSPTHQPIRRI